MLDDSDLEFAIWVPDPTTLPGLVVWLIFVLVVGYFVYQNHEECTHIPCADGQTAQLLDHQCLCVTKPGTPVPRASKPAEPIDLGTTTLAVTATEATDSLDPTILDFEVRQEKP